MPAMRFQACHIRTPLPGDAGCSALARWSVLAAEQDGKAPGFTVTRAGAERAVRSFAP